MAESLHSGTSQLPVVNIQKPQSVLGDSTSSSIASGIYYGHIGMVENSIGKIKLESLCG